ncbi:MAG: hypothetical protein JO061_00105 [Acidobacteriaceae bacterium]|nr:hypothetical protein [Acidobacteriaceae bacterium]
MLELNGHRGTGSIYLDLKVGQPLTLDAAGSYDPDPTSGLPLIVALKSWAEAARR